MLRLALFQPDIPQNAGTMMRMASALDIAVDIIEPCGFLFDDKRMRRAGMDYLDRLDLTRHISWTTFCRDRAPGRLVLLTTAASTPYTGFTFRTGDTIMVGRESAGVPDEVHAAADAHLVIPLQPHARSLNVAVAAAMVVGEGLRQLGRLEM